MQSSQRLPRQRDERIDQTLFFFLFRAAPTAYGSSQTRGSRPRIESASSPILVGFIAH